MRYICFLFSGPGYGVPREWLERHGLKPHLAVDLNKSALKFWDCHTVHASCFEDMYVPGEAFDTHLTLSWDGRKGAQFTAYRRKKKVLITRTYFYPAQDIIPRGSVILASPPCTVTCSHAHNLFAKSDQKEWMMILTKFLRQLIKMEQRQCIVIVELNIRKKYVADIEALGYIVVKSDAATLGSPSSRSRYFAMSKSTHFFLRTPTLRTGWGITGYSCDWYTNNPTFSTDYLRSTKEPAQTIGKKGLTLHHREKRKDVRMPVLALAILMGVGDKEFKKIKQNPSRVRAGLGMGFSSFHIIWVFCAVLRRLDKDVDVKEELKKNKQRLRKFKKYVNK